MSLHQLLAQHDTNAVITVLTDTNGPAIDLNATENGLTLLQVAAKEGLWEVVIILVMRGANLTQASENTKTPILLALENGHALVAQILLACKRLHDRDLDVSKESSIIRALLFYAIRHSENGLELLSLLVPKIKLLLQQKNHSNQYQLLPCEIMDFISFALDQNNISLAQKLMAIGAEVQASFRHSDEVVISIHNEKIEEKLADLFDKKDYTDLNALLNQTASKETLLFNALQQKKADLAVLLLIGTPIEAYNAALTCMRDPVVFRHFLDLIGGAKSLMHQMISRFVHIDANITKADRDLFKILSKDTQVEIDTVLRTLYFLHPNPEIASLMQDRDPDINQRIKNANISIPIQALLIERFERLGILVTPEAELWHPGDLKCANTTWQHAFSYLTKQEQKNVNQVSRLFHRLIRDSQRLHQEKLYSLQQKLYSLEERLAPLNTFINAVENDMAQESFFNKAGKYWAPMSATLVFGALIGVFSWMTYQYQQDLYDAQGRLSMIKISEESTCSDIYNDRIVGCGNNFPDVCDDICSELDYRYRKLLGIGWGVALACLGFLTSLTTFGCVDNRMRLNEYSEETQEAARIIQAENSGDILYFFEISHTAKYWLLEANRIKNRLTSEIATTQALIAAERASKEDLPEALPIPINAPHRFFAQNNIRPLDEDEEKQLIGEHVIEMTDLEERKENRAMGF